jgi:hypothetical protein
VPVFMLAVVAIYLYSGPFTAIGQNVVVPSLRGSAVTVSLLIALLLAIRMPRPASGCGSTRIVSLQLALLIVSPALLLVAAGLAWLALGSIKADIENMDCEWVERGADAPASVING